MCGNFEVGVVRDDTTEDVITQVSVFLGSRNFYVHTQRVVCLEFKFFNSSLGSAAKAWSHRPGEIDSISFVLRFFCLFS